MDTFEGRCLVVTGVVGNLGHAVAARLLARGARVLGVVRREEEAGRAASALAGAAAPAGAFRAAVADLGDEAQVEAAFEAALALGPLFGLCAAAGAWEGGRPVAETPLASFEKMIAANLRSSFLCARAAMRRLVPQGGGRIVLVSALSALGDGAGGGGNAAYAASKAGVVALARALAEEGAPHGVRVNCLAPATLRTPANQQAMPGADASRWVPLDEVAEAAAMLCAPGPLGVNGAILTLPTR